jgi:DNA-binding FrmR family transcriptional regulator
MVVPSGVGVHPLRLTDTPWGYILTGVETPGYIENKDALTKRMRRISGQVGGVERMIGEERYCIDILTQISAIQAALDKVAVGVLDDHVRHCVAGADESARDEKTAEMMAAVARLLRS